MLKTVYFIGAGPGNPDLLTVKAAKILSSAVAVLVDRLVSPDVLEQYVNPDAKIILVGKQGYCSHSAKQEEINELLIALAEEHGSVVRLKGGDTAFFSNILDELAVLQRHQIAYEIVPGITAASGASAYTGVPLTARGYATGVKFLSGCHLSKISDQEWNGLAEMKETLIWYMATESWPEIALKLILAGADKKMPLLVVEQASTSQQYVQPFFLGDFLNEGIKAEFRSPALIIVGKVAALYGQFSWHPNQSDRSAYFRLLQNECAHACTG